MPANPRSRGSSGSHGPQRPPTIAPMSERQQMALVMQMTSQSFPPAAPTPAEERKRTRQQRNERGETPLHVAAIKGDHEQVQKLLDQGLQPDVPDFAGWTALHEACSYGWYQVVEVLVNGGANVNAKGLDEDTPLHDAATSGNLKMVKFLIDHGANPFVKNTKGKMPADYAAPHIYTFFMTLKESKQASNLGRPRDEGTKKSGNASGTSGESSKRSSMDGLAQGEPESKDTHTQEKTSDSKEDGHNQVSSNVVSSSQDDVTSNRRVYYEEGPDCDEDDVSKRKKRKEEDKEVMGKHARTNNNRLLTGLKPPGPASKTGVAPLGKSNTNSLASKCTVGSSSKGGQSSQKGSGTSGKSTQSSHLGKSSSSSKGSLHVQTGKTDRKSPVASPKPKDDDDDPKTHEHNAPKVPPLKIVIPGGAGGSSNRNDPEGECGGSQRASKGRGGSSILPYVIPCTSTDAGQASDSSDSVDDKRTGDTKGTRVLRSHRSDDKERSPLRCSAGSKSSHGHRKSPTLSSHEDHQTPTVSSSTGNRNESGTTVELHPRKRKIKSSKDSHHSHRESKSNIDNTHDSTHAHSNPYQMYIHVKKQVDRRQKTLFPVKPKPPKDFNKYLMNRCTYTLQAKVNPEPQVEIPASLPPQMKEEFVAQEKERHELRVQHLVEKEKLVLAVEQEILRVHGRAERAVANQSLPFSVCTMLRDQEVYNVIAPEQEEKRNAQRSRCNGRQINSWLQEVDDKWEKIKEGMLRRQHTEVETLHAVQKMGWEWKLKELGLCDNKSTPKIDSSHVPQINVSNFDLPA